MKPSSQTEAQIRDTIGFFDIFIDSRKKNSNCLDVQGLPNITHNIVHKCTIITRRVQSICSKLWMLTISKKVKVGELPIDPDSIVALVLYTVLDTYVIVNNIAKKKCTKSKVVPYICSAIAALTDRLSDNILFIVTLL
ncbi:unnamed protein product [Brugia pahangi]|uniref:Transmembrane protein n=1 Tax=Brugia pahangi TaxID=6280 RepID=A0A0N4T088_BRUPA|nr:unnamed protein product [Brugia pahangi]